MESKHTPAPWAHEMDTETGFLIVAERVTVAMTNETEVEEGNISFEEAEANAKLIASAPKMIRQLCDTYQYLVNLNIDNWRGRLFGEGQRQLVMLRDLIAESLGLSSQEVQEYFENNKSTL